MQGTLKEIDISTLINLIELGQKTGELLIESSQGEFWFLFFDAGQLIYATTSNSNLNRLRDYLYGLGLDSQLNHLASPKLRINVLEYEQIWTLLENQILTVMQAQAILSSVIKEVLFDVLSLYQGKFVFEVSTALTPKLSRFKFSELSSDLSRQIRQWKEFYPLFQSVHQCPVVISKEAPPNLLRWVDGKTSLRQLSRYLMVDIYTIGKKVFDAIAAGQMAITSSTINLSQQSKPQTLKILCIDDSVTICRTVEYILNKQGFQVTAVSSSIKALSLVFQYKPNFILCDISMPELNGYELCGMLRKSTAFAKVPIIMLTGQDGFIDRVKARMVGATEYLTKPFGEKELLTMLEKYSSYNFTIN